MRSPRAGEDTDHQSTSRSAHLRRALLTVGLLAAVGGKVEAQHQISEIIESLRASEQLYDDIDVQLRRTRRFDPSSHLTAVRDATAWLICQKTLIYFSNTERQTTQDGQLQCMDILLAYDGHQTRVIERRSFIHVHDGRWEHPELFRPHTLLLERFEDPRLSRPQHDFALHLALLLRPAPAMSPLSIYLAGPSALSTVAGDSFHSAKSQYDVQFEKEELVDGLGCLKIRLEGETGSGLPSTHTICFLWLALDRNHLPIRVESYRPHINAGRPVHAGRLEDLREIAPGVWFPFRASVVTYDQDWLRDNKLFVSSLEEYTVEKAALDPRYDISLFRDIPCPTEIPVYVVKNGQIVKSYFHGEYGDIMPTGRPWLLWAILGGLGVLAAIAGFLYYRSGRQPWLGLWMRKSHRRPPT